MRILLLTHSFNSLTQRLHVELRKWGFDVSVEFDINDDVTREAVALFRPDVILASYLRRAIPRDVWERHLCLVVHPGPAGDRGPSALDWAIMRDLPRWGVTVLQAEAEMDAGPVWAAAEFDMRPAAKSSLYRREVTAAAVRAVRAALERMQSGDAVPQRVEGRWNPSMRQSDRAIDWTKDPAADVIRKVRSADGWPGVRTILAQRDVYLFDAHAAPTAQGTPGHLIAHNGRAVCVATVDGGVWIGHLRAASAETEHRFKLPAVDVLGDALDTIPQVNTGPEDIVYEEADGVGTLRFSFYNGAMDTAQCRRLRDAVRAAQQRPIRVLCLAGGEDFWSNGIHLNRIEAAARPADESWRNINAMNDLVREIVTNTDQVTVSALGANGAAGGCFLALASDFVVAREGVILNPHYKNMGNLYGSEYWTYLLPRRVGRARVAAVMGHRLPMGTDEAQSLELLDATWSAESYDAELQAFLHARSADGNALLKDKRMSRARDEAEKSLDAYRDEELEHIKLNFYGFDPSYHVARYHFVHKTPHSRTPPYLATHRRIPAG